MRKMLVFVIIILCLFCITSCDNDKDKSLPTTSEIMLEPTEDFYLLVEYEKELDSREIEMYVSVLSKSYLLSLSLGQDNYPTDSFSYNASLGYYSYWFDINNIAGTFDQELSYVLRISDKTISGSLAIPSEYYCVFPTFDPEQDYSLNWILQNNPDVQNVNHTFETLDHGYYHFIRDLQPAQRSHVLDGNVWSQLDEIIGGYIVLDAINYKYTHGGLVYISSNMFYGFGTWKHTKLQPSRLIDMLKTGRIPQAK
jgi:hypothetical protein